MFGLQEIRYANSRIGSGRENSLSRAQVADMYGVPTSSVRRAANNSWGVILPDGVAYVHVRTQVVRAYYTGAVVLDSGGWHTVTTKDRINRFQHVCRVYSDRGRWLVNVHMPEGTWTYKFQDGMTVHANGRTLAANGDRMAGVFKPRTAEGA